MVFLKTKQQLSAANLMPVNCPHLKDGQCEYAMHWCSLPEVPVTEKACAECLKIGEFPNSVVASISVAAVRLTDPDRLNREILPLVLPYVNRFSRDGHPVPAPHEKNGVGTAIDRVLRQRGVYYDCDFRKLVMELNEHDPQWCEDNWKTIVDQLRPGMAALLFAGIKRMQAKPKRVILSCPLSPGDIATMTAAVHSLHERYPNQFVVDVRTPVPAIWEHNPGITPLAEADQTIEMHYPAVDKCNSRSAPFLAGYTEYLGDMLGVTLRLSTNRPHLYLSDEERGWLNQVAEKGHGGPFWLVSSGVKSDYTAKQWPVEFYQQVVEQTKGVIQWVQVGAEEHDHVPLDGVINLIGQTDPRQLIRLAYHASGGLGPVTYLQHLCAAWEKPYVCLLGGREPAVWTQYPRQHTLHTIGALDCCRTGACWRSRVVKRNDGEKSDQSLCEKPVLVGKRPVGRCMQMITPADVVSVLRRYV